MVEDMTLEKIKELKPYQKTNIVNRYFKACNTIDIPIDLLYTVRDPYELSDKDTQLILSLCIVVQSLLEIFTCDRSAKDWLSFNHSDAPFDGKSPLDLLKTGRKGVLQTKFYVNGLRVCLKQLTTS